MTEKSLPLNPWLTDVVQLFRKSRSDSYLRDLYQMSCDKGENLSWPEFMTRSSLEEFLHKNPFLKKSLAMLDITDKAKDILYWAGVDSLYDLLQITKEELGAICINEEQVKEEITQYLTKLGKELKSYPGKTSKLSLAYGYWTIPSPGASHNFNFARPTLREEWFNEYYKLKEHVEEEERLDGDLRDKVLIDVIPDSFKEYWDEVRDFFDAYETICRREKLADPIPTPFIPVGSINFNFKNDSFKELRMQAIRAFIDVMERTRLFRYATPGDFLSVNLAEDRAMIADKESEAKDNEVFAALLNIYILINIDFENLLWDLMDKEEYEKKEEDEDEKKDVVLPPINAYLEQLVNQLTVKDMDAFKEDYKRALEDARHKGRELSWAEFLGEQALMSAIVKNPVLKMHRAWMPLPQDVKDALYWIRVDVVADLLQISEEELLLASKREGIDVEQIKRFLDGFGLKLCTGTTDSWKIPALRIIHPAKAGRWQIWEFSSLKHEIHPARPALVPEWFDVYYKNYEYQAFKEELGGKLRYVKPEANNGEIPKAIFDFLQDTRYFFDAYKKVCQENESQIHQVVEEPDEKWFTDDFDVLSKFTNEHYLAIKKDVVRAMISVLENTDLLGMPTYFFLRLKDDEKKIKIIEGLKNQNFQLMMIEYVAVRIGMDDVVVYFMELDKNAQDKKPESVKPEPVNPWLAELIKLYRKEHDNEAIREAYKQFCEANPDKSWADYLGEEALCDAIRRSPYLATRLEDMDMPEKTTQILKDNCSVDTLVDIMQITKEEFNVLFEDSRGDLNVLVHFLEQTFDLRLYHHDFYTYKLSVPWDRFTPQAIS